jgi:hypothetical protein
MSFDSSRFTFNSWNDFLGVVMQQGRVQLDADWNEWLAQFTRRMQAGSLDTFGRAVAPATTPNGFKINAYSDATGQHLTIGAGRMYIDGLMVENHGPAAKAVWDSALAELSGAPAAPPAVTEIDLDFTAQPYLPNAQLPKGSGPFLVYLDVWKRAITYLEHPELIDPAVGIDTTGRVQIVWQVKLLDVSNVTGVNCFTPDGSITAWTAITQSSGARLTTGVVPSSPSGPCCLNSATGYTGLENQLYRVEIHQGGNSNSSGTGSPVSATFKWSRDNASVITTVTAINPATNAANNPTSQLTVESTGRDDVLSFKPGDWIEITDDFLELNGQAGELHQIDSNGVSKALKTITLQTPVSNDLQNRLASGINYHTRICRWDQGGKVYLSDGATLWTDLGAAGSTGQIPVPPPGTSLILENGVTVSFDLDPSLGNFHVGDFWTFPARASDGSVEVLTKAPPMGIHHHYARLSIVTFPSSASDCRTIWPPQTSAAGDCACTVCVDAADHNSGQATLAMAVEKIRSMGGGRICLGPGVYMLNSTLTLQGLHSVILSGQGPATSLVMVGNGPAITVENSIALGIEDLGVYALAQGSDTVASAGVVLRNCIEVGVERCIIAVLAAGAPQTTPGTPTSSGGATFEPVTIVTAAPVNAGTIGIVLDGFLIEARIRDNLVSAEIGIGQSNQFAAATGTGNITMLSDSREILMLADLEVVNNLLSCDVAGIALLGFGDKTLAQLNIFLLEIALRENRVVGCSLLGIGVAGVTMPDAALRIAGNHIDVSGTGIICGSDGIEIADNLVTQAMTAGSPATGKQAAATNAVGIGVISVPGGKLPVTAARILRNRINTCSGPGISVDGVVLTASIVGNSVMFVTQTGIAFTGPQVPSEVMIRDNEVFNVVPLPAPADKAPTPGSETTGATLGRELFVSSETVIKLAGVAGIKVNQTTVASIENNSVALIGVSGQLPAVGISAGNSAEVAVIGNDISDIGSITAPAGEGGAGIATAGIAVANVSSNTIRQTSSGSTTAVPFRGIITSSLADGKLTGEALVNGNMVYGNSANLVDTNAGHCVLNGNLCKQGADVAGSDTTAVMLANAFTCVASNNRILSAGKLIGLSITVPADKQPKATVLGNIAAIGIQLNGSPLGAPWAPLNIIE